MNQKTTLTRHCLGTDFRDRTERRANRLLSPEPPNNFAPLIRRVVRAMRAVRVLGAGLGFPVGEPSVFTPNLRQIQLFLNKITIVAFTVTSTADRTEKKQAMRNDRQPKQPMRFHGISCWPRQDERSEHNPRMGKWP